MNINEFINEVDRLGLKLNDDMLNKLNIYKDYLIEYNKHTNLTRITNVDDIYLKHFYDSLTILKSIDLDKYNNLIDVGSGAGFPGMVIAICFPKLKVVLLDSSNKRVDFLNSLINKLGLNNVKTVCARAEEYAKNNLDTYDIVTSRAVADLEILSELCIPLVKVNGYFIALKSNIDNELDNSKGIISKLNANIDNIYKFMLPDNKSVRTIIKIKKIKKTPNGYPREYAKIKRCVEKHN